MTILMVITSYLLIGAMIGWKDSVLVEQVIEISLDTVNAESKSDNYRKAAISLIISLIILVAPILELYFIIMKLKSKLGR